jgi:hypothetical protein
MVVPVQTPEKTPLMKNVALLSFFFIFVLGEYFLFGESITAESIFWGVVGALFVYFLWVTEDDYYPGLYCEECDRDFESISQFNNHPCQRK